MGIRDILGRKIILCDGAMGTQLQKYGLQQAGELPETLNFTHPEIIERIYKEYIAAGSDLVCTNTFGANSWKLAGSGYTVEQVIKQAVRIGRKAGAPWVALDIAPIGRLMEPTGDLGFEEACKLYREQISAGVEAGVDLIVFETFTDLYDMKAAVVTARELTDLPIFCTVTFEEDGRMLMGADPLTVVNILQDLGIDAIGTNCSLGPGQMLPIVREMLRYSKLPLMVQPNAGLPRIEGGQTVFDVGVQEFTMAMKEMIKAGVSIVGGCCGTTPEYIKALSDCIKPIGDLGNVSPVVHRPFTGVSSSTKTVILDDRVRIIGERINPTGKKRLKEALKNKDFAYIENQAISQVKAGAEILDINVGLPEIDEEQMMLETVRRVSAVTDVPLQIDSADPRVLEKAVRLYNGKPIINSVNGKQEVMDAVFPIVKKYGACVIALTLDENGLPKNAEERLAIAERIIKEAAAYGIDEKRILVDCLTLTVSAQQQAGRDTLDAIRLVKQCYDVKTVLGVSNVSFGLPERELLNQTFLAMALEAGLDAPITDPLVSGYVDTIRAFEALACKDEDSKDFITCYGGKKAVKTNEVEQAEKQSAKIRLRDIILNGYTERAAAVTQELLTDRKPLEIVEKIVIPALENVGEDYEKGFLFLPQLVKSADTVKAAFDVLKTAMETTGETISYGRIIMATVKGDIHDIGKNIVKVILENYGYEVLDLGKDTDIDLIVRTAKEGNIKLVGLSALMTTTVVNMEATIKALQEAEVDCKVMVGGAVLNPEYADKIKADYYCKDAMAAVKVAKSVFKEES
ncbi:MAG: homocysteine S-methyltransferase family protein [Eubacteriales bacterium]|nr:homocysteine S-methyltransferase family protein [Eubacteriales bacterium]